MTDEKKNDETEVSPFLQSNVTQSKNVPAYNHVNEKIEEIADTTCGFWIFKGPLWQRFANENMYMVLYGITGCVISMAFAYFNATITTLEKRYKIPTKTSGIISVGNDISTTLTSGILAYYAGGRHRPRWIGVGLFTQVLFCLGSALPHFLYGPGEDALKLTAELSSTSNITDRHLHSLCNTDEPSCQEESDGHWMPIFILFTSQFLSGIGCALFYTLGLTYMDDNSTKDKAPAMLSWSTFLRMLGPAIGYSLASLCLRVYISPTLRPLIKDTDPRWLGAWWMGWIVLAAIMFISAIAIIMFPKELPSARRRRLKLQISDTKIQADTKELSFENMLRTIKGLLTNKVYVYNTLSSIFYFFGYTPYWIFTPKYIETQFRQSAAMASMVTGSVALAFSAAGVLISGLVISKYKPSARSLSAWNGIVDFSTLIGILCYVAIGCKDSDNMGTLSVRSSNCTISCYCDYVQYSPICGGDNITYISPCHAGCTEQTKDALGHTVYSGCDCMTSSSLLLSPENQIAHDGACPVDCSKQFLIFLAVMCFLKFIGASGRSTNILIALRCVPAEDKSFALGFGSTIISIATFIPSPIFFGWLLDNYCLVWGKTCTNKGNCWLYDTKSLRYTLNLTASVFIFIGTFLNVGVWLNAKNLKIFDEHEKNEEIQMPDADELSLAEMKIEPKVNQ